MRSVIHGSHCAPGGIPPPACWSEENSTRTRSSPNTSSSSSLSASAMPRSRVEWLRKSCTRAPFGRTTCELPSDAPTCDRVQVISRPAWPWGECLHGRAELAQRPLVRGSDHPPDRTGSDQIRPVKTPIQTRELLTQLITCDFGARREGFEPPTARSVGWCSTSSHDNRPQTRAHLARCGRYAERMTVRDLSQPSPQGIGSSLLSVDEGRQVDDHGEILTRARRAPAAPDSRAP